MKRLHYADLLGFLTMPGATPDGVRNMREHLATAHCDGLRLVHVTTAPPWAQNAHTAAEVHTMFVGATSDTGIFSFVKSQADAHMMFSEHASRIGLVSGLQGTPIKPEDGRLEDQVRMLMRAGIRVMGLCYDGITPFGCGWRAEKERNDSGLTLRGQDLINVMRDEGMILDLAHAGAHTALGAIQHACRVGCPVMVSHTGCRGVYSHFRNLPDEVLREVANAGGVVGVYMLTFGLHPTDNNIGAFTHHVEHALSVVGEENLAVGTDGCVGGYPNLNAWRANVDALTRELDPDGSFGARWPDQCNEPSELTQPTRLSVVRDALMQSFRGQSTALSDAKLETRVARIMGGNVMRFFEDSLPRTP